MEIGGYDLIYDSEFPVQSHHLIDACRTVWPTLVVEYDPEPGEFFVYRDMDSAVSWEVATETDDPDHKEGPMVYFILGDKDFTAVMDDPAVGDEKLISEALDKVFSRRI